MINWILCLVGIWGIVLGIHGIYVGAHWWQPIFAIAFGKDNALEKLFLSIDLPIGFLSKQVEWVSNESLQSFFVPLAILPLAILASGICLLLLRERIAYKIRRIL